jgi:hypothetical protein
LTIVLALGARMMVSILLHPLRIGWDPALHLMCATLICQGKLPYVDMFDVNPPLIWYMNTLPASLSNVFHAPLPLSFNFFLLLMIVGSGLMSAYVIVTKLDKKDLFVNLGVVFGLLLFNFFLSVDFGQREEIFVLLYMPFFFLRMARWQGLAITRNEAILFGIVGGAGIFLKHYFVLNFLVVELFFFLSSRVKALGGRLKPLIAPENLTMVAFGVLYLLHFFILPAAVRHNYFDFLVPAFSKGYYFWDTTVPNCISVPNKKNIFVLLMAAAALALPLLRIYPVVGPIISFSLAGLVVYLLQFKGWAYQDMPVMAGGFMLCGAILGMLITLTVVHSQPGGLFFKIAAFAVSSAAKWLELPVVHFKPGKNLYSLTAYGLAVLVAGVCLVSAQDEISLVSSFPRFDMSVIGYSGSTPKMDVDTPFTDLILANTRSQDPIVFISNGVAPGFPIIMQLRRTPASRHLHVCILSVLHYIQLSGLTDPETKRLLSYEPRVVDELGQDILESRPRLVFLQDQPIKSEYLVPHKFVEKYLSNYKVIDDVAGFSVYRLNGQTPATPAVAPAPAATPAVAPVPAATNAVAPVPAATNAVAPVPAATPAVVPAPNPVVAPAPVPAVAPVTSGTRSKQW